MDGYSKKFDYNPYDGNSMVMDGYSKNFEYNPDLKIEQDCPEWSKGKINPIQNCYDKINKEFEKDSILTYKIKLLETVLVSWVDEIVLSIKEFENKISNLEKNFKESKKEGFVSSIIRKLRERRAKK